MGTQFREVWRCGNCGQDHDDPVDAGNCCQPDIEEILICEYCGTECQDEKEARACCQDIEESIGGPPATPLELEAAGQQRLFV